QAQAASRASQQVRPPVDLRTFATRTMAFTFRRAAGAFLCAALALACSLTVAQQLFELEPEYVYGRNRKPRLGYHRPEVFDPLSDQLYQSGYRDYPPPAIPDELKQVDAMTRVQKMGRILVCADGWFWPFSRTARKKEPAGIEIELMHAIARKH